MKRQVFSLVCSLVLLGSSSVAQTVYGITIPASHPRLFWTSARLAQAHSWWTTHSFVPSGNVYDYLLAYEMTGNNAYCNSAIADANSNASSIAACSKTGNNGCDQSRWNGENYILTYDACYNMMGSSQQTTMRNNLNSWVPGNNGQSWGGPGMSQNNYYWGDLRNSLEFGISSYPENTTAADAAMKNALVTRYQNDFVPASNTGEAGGLGLEGNEYGPYVSHYVGTILFPAVESMGRDIFNETRYWQGTVLNRVYMTPPQQTLGSRGGWDVFPFNDDQNWQNGSPGTSVYVGNFMTQAANQWASIGIGQYARQWLNTVSPTVDNIVQAVDAGGTAQDFSSLPLDYYSPGPKYMVGRNNWTTDATTYLWQMGDLNGVGHDHTDWGTFQINRKGEWLTRESPGYGNSVGGYGGSGTQDTQVALAHQVPLINGNGGVNAGCWDASPPVNRLESQSGYAYADVNLIGVYRNDVCSGSHPERENTAAIKVEREYFFIRDNETFVIFDRLQSDTAGRSKTFVWHCEVSPTAVDGTHKKCVNGTQQLYVTTLLPASPSSMTVVNEACCGANPAPPSQYRIEVNDSPGVTTSYTLHVMQAMDSGGMVLTPSVVDSAPGTPLSGTFTVTIDQNHRLVLQKGMTSSGGSITINGSTTNLRSDVQGISITDDGPVWAESGNSPNPPSPPSPPTGLTAIVH